MASLTIGLSFRNAPAAYDRYPRALLRAGEALGVAVDPQWLAAGDRDLDRELLARVDGVLLTGGDDVAPERYRRSDLRAACETIDERRDAIEWSIAAAAFEHALPLLAVCRGMQLLNVYCGGTLIAHVPNAHDHRMPNNAGFARHDVRVAPDGSLARALGERIEVNSSHHQAVDELAAPFRAIAWAPDGIVEAYERQDPASPFLLGVQWHPEAMNPGEPPADYPLQAFVRSLIRSRAPL